MIPLFPDIEFQPLFDGLPAGLIFGMGLLGLGFMALYRLSGFLWRALAIVCLMLLLAGPIITIEQKQAKPDIALIMVDRTASQNIGKRAAQTDLALGALQDQLTPWPDMEYRVIPVETPSLSSPFAPQGSRVFSALNEAISDIPPAQLAGVILLTDGQIHDVPPLDPDQETASHPLIASGAPLHALLSGDPQARDRRLVIEETPDFGIVSQPVPVRVRLEDAGNTQPTILTVAHEGETILETPIRPGESLPLELPITHRGQTIFDLSVDVPPGDIAPENNQVFLPIQGIRERLRVLLVSGQPYAGTRIWRNLLKSDPAVDLVHFTILRSPNKQDSTPQDELSLISFPIRELFEVKLKEFDLIVFDRYWRRGMLAADYLQNVADYVQEGGALLEIAGPHSATSLGLGRSAALRDILTAQTTNRVMAGEFQPRLTRRGQAHPVTQNLTPSSPGEEAETPPWGAWFRHVESEARQGDILMRGLEDAPLLILNRVGKGRAAQLMSDHVWLWARGYQEGGPHSELIRRLAHWLMQEPELEENALRATVEGNQLTIERRHMLPDPEDVTLTFPSGEERILSLDEQKPGLSRAVVEIETPGLYRLADQESETFIVAGLEQALEFSDLQATETKLQPFITASRGGLHWLSEAGIPELKAIRQDEETTSPQGEKAWIGLRRNEAYEVTGTKKEPLPPVWLALLMFCALLIHAWRRETT